MAEIILNATEIRHIGEQSPGIDQVFVHIIEVRKQHVAPEDELIQGFLERREVLVDFIQFQDQGHLVGFRQAARPVEKVIDRHQFGHKVHGAVRVRCHRL